MPANPLTNVKVGDRLIVHTRYNQYIETVQRITATLVITKTHRFRKTDGIAPGSDSWQILYACVATPEKIEAYNKKVKRKNLITDCENIKFPELSDTQLEKILEIANTKE